MERPAAPKPSDAPFTITGIPRPSSPESDTRSAFGFRNRRLGCWITHLAFLFSRRNLDIELSFSSTTLLAQVLPPLISNHEKSANLYERSTCSTTEHHTLSGHEKNPQSRTTSHIKRRNNFPNTPVIPSKQTDSIILLQLFHRIHRKILIHLIG